MMGMIMMALPIGIVATAFAEEVHRRAFVVTWGMVARVPLFSGLSAIEIADIMELLRAEQIEADEVVVRRGEAAHSMYFVAAGEVEIALDSERIRLGAGHFFGEIAVLRRARRSATVTALTRTSLLVLDAHDLHALMARQPASPSGSARWRASGWKDARRAEGRPAHRGAGRRGEPAGHDRRHHEL